MEEVQSWWEVPAIAHFCYAFKDAFNLFFLEIGELEAAILNIQDPEMCISLEQLITRLLQGCYEADDVTSDNWEEKLSEIFEDNCEEDENPLSEECPFNSLTPKDKVKILFKLCEFRLDAAGALDAIKDIQAEDMQAKCVGKDSQNNSYWYFCDERLYKENSASMGKEINVSVVKNKSSKSNITNGKSKSRTKKEKVADNSSSSWSIACFNASDWEKLAKRFSRSKNSEEKNLASTIKDKYLPFLQEVVAEKDRFLRKRFAELAPKRTSSRISKVQALKKIEEQKAIEEAEKTKRQTEDEEAKKKAKIIKEKEERQKRVEERHKAHERAIRVQLREESRYVDEKDFEEKRMDNSQARAQKVRYADSSSDEDSRSKRISSVNKRDYSKINFVSDKPEHKSVGKKSEQSTVVSKLFKSCDIKQNTGISNGSSKWTTANIHTKECKLRIYHGPPTNLNTNKRLKTDSNVTSQNGNVKEIKTFYKVAPYSNTSFITYGKIKPPPLIRVNFMKS